MTASQGTGPNTLATDSADTESVFLRFIQNMVLYGTGVFLVVVSLWFVRAGLPASLNLRFNWYALLQVAAFASTTVALYLVTRVQRYSTMLTWLSLLLMGVAVWLGAEALSWFGATPETASFWSSFATVGTAFIPCSLFMFALAYTNSRRAQQPLMFISLVCASLLILYVDTHTALIELYGATPIMSPHPWGYVVPTADGYWLFSLWFIGVGIAALLQMYAFWRRTTDAVLRKQARVITIAVAIPIVGGGITDALLPALRIGGVMPLGVMLCSIMGLVFSYGVLRYRYFTFTPSAIGNQILETMNEAVIGTTPDMRITYVNAAAERLIGLNKTAFYSRRITDFLTQQLETQQLKEELHRLLAATSFGTIDSVDLRIPNGAIKTVKMSITKIVGQGQPYGYVVVLTDLTTITQATLMIERQVAAQTQAVRETKTQLMSSINSVSFGFLITNAKAEVVMVNNVAHKLFCGSREHDATLCPVVTMEHIQKDYIVDVPLMKALQDCLSKREPQRIKTAVFNHRTWRIFISPMIEEADRVTGAVLVIQDITEEQILARSRDEFFSIASHELRTPLTAIRGNASLMMDYYPEALKDPSLKEMVNDIHDSSERLITIVNDFLDVSRLEQGRVTYQFEEVSVVKTVEKVVYEMGTTAKQAGIYLRMGPGLKHHTAVPNVIADPGRLKQILYNLIGNATKFTEKGGVTINAEATAHHIRISVTDTGRGIPPEMQPLLFHKFQQAGESLLTRDSTKGTGLGLYISRLLARGMGGMLVLEESAPGKGSAFILTLPVASAARLKRMLRSGAEKTKQNISKA